MYAVTKPVCETTSTISVVIFNHLPYVTIAIPEYDKGTTTLDWISLMHPNVVKIPAIIRNTVAHKSPDCLKPTVKVNIPAAIKPKLELVNVV